MKRIPIVRSIIFLWDLVEKDFTLVTIPGAGHFVQQDTSDLITTTMSDWLARRIH